MEALSSLITRQSRKDRTAIGGKFSKLERMAMYIKVIKFLIFYVRNFFWKATYAVNILNHTCRFYVCKTT